MIEYTMTARCDGCGLAIAQEPVKVGDIDRTRWRWLREWKLAGVLRVQQWRAPEKLYCKPCADGRRQPATRGFCAMCGKLVVHAYPWWTANPERNKDAKPLHDECARAFFNPE